MALIKLTAIVDNISGKLNGTVFSRNKGGHYMRSKSKPTNPRTAPQMAVRAAFGAISQLWRGLTEAQRAAWQAAAADFPYQNKLGDSKELSGFALHQKLNRNLQLIGQSALSTPPAPEAVPAPTAFNVNASLEAEFKATAAFSAETSPESYVLVFATPPLSPGVSNFENRLRQITSTKQSGFDAGEVLLDNYSARFGTPPVGAKIGFRIHVVNVNTGQDSAPFDTEIIVTA